MTEHFVQTQTRVREYPPIGILSFLVFSSYFDPCYLNIFFFFLVATKLLKIGDIALDSIKPTKNWGDLEDEEEAPAKSRKRKAHAKKGKETSQKEGPTKKCLFLLSQFSEKAPSAKVPFRPSLVLYIVQLIHIIISFPPFFSFSFFFNG